MELFHNEFYHLYNRSNNKEVVFRSHDNYLYFLRKYRAMLGDNVETIAYCLMPTHFHFLIRVITSDTDTLKMNVGKLLSSYTRAVNLQWKRHGSLFQRHTKSKRIESDRQILTLLTYIHQNPVRAKLVLTPQAWIYSSYLEYIEVRTGTLPQIYYGRRYFPTLSEFKEFSESKIDPTEITWAYK